MGRPTYTDQTRQHAIALAVEHGPAEAARQLAAQGIHVKATTLRSWCSRAGIATVATERTAAAVAANKARWDERRSSMVDEIGEVAQMALDHTRQALTAGDGRTAKDAATTMAILVDKAQLLSGGVTGRVATNAERAAAVAEGRERGLRLVGAA